MEHLPSIADPAYPLPKIPCYCKSDDYDGQGMADFPQRVGWKIDRQDGPVRFDETKSRIASPMALLQAWLFFGFLQDVFSIGQTKIEMHAFQQQIGRQCYLSTAALKEFLIHLERAAWQLKPDACLQRQKQVLECFKILLNFLHRHWDTRTTDLNWKVTSTLSLDHIMVFVILGETLRNAVTQIWPVPSEKSPLRWSVFRWKQNPFKDRFLQAGWCPSEATMLYNEIDNTGLFFATMLKRPFSDKLSHKECSNERCLALQTSDENYETKHVNNCSNCRNIDIDQKKICNILRYGSTPVIYVETTENEELSRVRIVDFNANSLEYIAISHVWAHGLGNPRKSALPLCQVMRLHSLVGKLSYSINKKPQPLAFWIDTLCIPVDPELKEFRKLAISRLDGVFRRARQVLVLDADLQRCSRRGSKMESATRIACSGWMRRLWTLSEAVVAEETANAAKVDVQFLEGSVEFNAVAGRDIFSIFHTETVLPFIFSTFPQFHSRATAFAFLTRALQYRSTSRPEDEPLCLASILGFKSGEIAVIASANTTEERTQLMYTLMDHVPASILFNRWKKLSNGFRWAPASLFGASMTPLPGEAGRCSAQGLHVQYSGYVMLTLLPNSTRPIRGKRYIGDPSEAAPILWVTSSTPGASVESSYKAGIELDKFLSEAPKPGLILNPHDSNESALVSVYRDEGSIIYATFERIVAISKPRMESRVHNDWRDYLMDVREAPPTQKWCIN